MRRRRSAVVDAPGTSLADTLDVIVDGTWQLSSGGLARLVDQVGGVTVDVDVDVLATNRKGRAGDCHFGR